MIRLSVNVNKIATLRNSRGGNIPSVLQAVDVCLAAGAPGITVHPREDERHIRPGDVVDIARRLAPLRGSVELNIEGDARPALIDLALSVRPDQFTLVPVAKGELTSQAGWSASTPPDQVKTTVARLRAAGIRVSLFVDPVEAAIRWASSMGADRIELFTEPFARAFAKGDPPRTASFSTYDASARQAHALGLGINAGHDLDLDNLLLFRTLPHLDEVSIGHALISHALWVGLERAVRDYLEILRPHD
jgi:pyridoxine 5-phosphate synthase